MIRNRAKAFTPALVPPPAIDLSENSRQVLRKRYLRRGLDGKPAETVEGMFRRVARAVAEPDGLHGFDVQTTEDAFYALLTGLRFFPNSPTFTGAATPLGQLAACFVLPISDDMGRESDGIFQTLRDAALIQQTGGGNGFSFSRLRPKGDSVATSAGVATGPVGFLRVYDTAFGEVAQGGTRRGANMAVLRVDHPDIEDFITCKVVEGAISNFNISVGITDDFMRAVAEDGEFRLINPRDAKSWRSVCARDLFEKIVTYAHHNGEPGALFLDAANRTNPVPHLYHLEATNPCGEQWLGPYENCCLGSVNLAVHITDDGRVDWEKLRETVLVSTRFLDNVVDANKYVPSVPQLREAAMRARRIGLGMMGLGDMMYALGVRYGSLEGQEFAAQVMEFIRFHCMLASVELARERGPFLALEGSIYDPQDLRWKPPQSILPYANDWGRPELDWKLVLDGVRQWGIRNAAQTTVAPTGTIGTVAGCEGYGCEPVFALAYTRTVKDGDRDLKLTYTSPLFEKALVDAGLDENTRLRISERVLVSGSCDGIEEVPEALRHVFVVASDVTAEEHVRMQGAIQAFVDNSISKTINFPATATVAEVAQAYRLAWELGCKGLTVYVTGSRDEVVLETKATAEAKAAPSKPPAEPSNGTGRHGADPAVTHEAAAAAWPEPAPDSALAASYTGYASVGKRPRPSALPGVTYRKETPLGAAYVTVNVNGEQDPFEVFLNVGKAGSDVAAVSEALGRLISLSLRLPSPLSPNERLQQVVDQLAGIGGGRSMGFGPNRVRSLPDAVAQVLAQHLADYADAILRASAEADGLDDGSYEHTPPALLETEGHSSTDQLALPIADRQIGDLCPDCGQATFIPTEGCRKCYACGYSEC
jgi:ribonucleoside-diphosphate reductase alpha chain